MDRAEKRLRMRQIGSTNRAWDAKCPFRSLDLVFCLCHFITLDGVNFGSEIVVI